MAKTSRRTKRHSVLFIPAFVLALLGLLLFPIVGRCTEKTEAIVTEVDDEFKLTYKIKTKTLEGSPSISMNQLTNKVDYDLNDSVEILYNPRNHKNFIIKDENFNILSYMLLGAGVVMFVVDTTIGEMLPESFVFRLLNKKIG